MSNFPMGFSHKTAPWAERVNIPEGIFQRTESLIWLMRNIFTDDIKYLNGILDAHPGDIKNIDLMKVSALESILSDLEARLEAVDKLR